MILGGTEGLWAQATLACKQTEQMGLYEQCEEVKIMKALGDRMRVYSLARKKLVMMETQNIFSAESVEAKDTIQANDLLSIPGRFLWSSSTHYHQTLCKVENKASDKNVLQLDCGKDHKQKVNRNLVYRLKRIPESSNFSANFQSKK